MREKLREMLEQGMITQSEYDIQIDALNLRDQRIADEAVRAQMREDEESRLQDWKDEIKVASLSTIKKMCKQRAGVMNAFAAIEPDYYERNELSTTARRLNGAIRGAGVGSAF